MRRDLKILVLVLAVPLLLYGTGYAYADLTITSYVRTNSAVLNSTLIPYPITRIEVYCDPGDFATGGGHFIVENTNPWELEKVNVIMSGARPAPTPNYWVVKANNPERIEGITLYARVVCMSPIAVAGIGVPEFGSIYIVMILGAAVFFVLTRMGKLQLKLVPVKKST